MTAEELCVVVEEFGATVPVEVASRLDEELTLVLPLSHVWVMLTALRQACTATWLNELPLVTYIQLISAFERALVTPGPVVPAQDGRPGQYRCVRCGKFFTRTSMETRYCAGCDGLLRQVEG